MKRIVTIAGCAAVASACAGCFGWIGELDDGASSSTDDSADLAKMTAAVSLRRLSRAEYDHVLRDLLGETASASKLLPEDALTPFDNDASTQTVSKALVEAVEKLASDAASRLVASSSRRDRMVGCQPSSPGDTECLERFVKRFGRRALRRPLPEADVDELVALAAKLAREAKDFDAAVETVVRVLLQRPEFLYRVEVGTPVAGKPELYRLDDFEIASRLSFLVWGSLPDDWMLDLAAKGELHTAAQRKAALERMLGDKRARGRIARFFALWLGYDKAADSKLAKSMRRETDALISKVIFEERQPWQEILRSDKTYVDAALATHYGLANKPSGSGPQWVSYGDSGRRGLLSHATFLSNGAKGSDTSPTLRGLAIRERLFCQEIPPPPPNVNADEPPPKTADKRCKKDRYAAHATGGCAGCHAQIDPVGFGLENYDALGRYRKHDPGEPSCTIDGKGKLVGVGTFRGPAGLAQLALRSGLVSGCLIEQLVRFAIGHAKLDKGDRAFVALLEKRLAGASGKKEFRFDQLLAELVASPVFIHRRLVEDKGS